MLGDLLWHELEVVKSFWARTLSSATLESTAENARLLNASEEAVEEAHFHPHGAFNFEQIAIRSVINELNALCEFALQDVWRAVAKDAFLSNNEFVISANRNKVQNELKLRDVDVSQWPNWLEVEKIKELSEGFKHRQRLQPFPAELHIRPSSPRARRVFDPANEEWIVPYDLKPTDATNAIEAVESLLIWLRAQYAV